jgi:F420-dependent oxidoreductase-like protein
MRIGLFISEVSGAQTTVDGLLEGAREAEAMGFHSGWVPHIPWSLDGLTALALAGQVTEHIELGTAVMPTYTRHPMAMAQQALSAQAAANGRVVLGIGPSHQSVIEHLYGMSYDRPAAHTREYVEVLRNAFACTGMLEYHGEFFDFAAPFIVPGAAPAPIMVAALAPLMLRMAGEISDGTITYWANERALEEHIVPRLSAAAANAGRETPRIVCGLPIGVCHDGDAGREQAARIFEAYTAIPTYQRVLARGGEGTSPADVAVIGTEEDVAARLRGFADTGATDLMAAVLGLGDDREGNRRRTLDLLASL